LPDRGHDAHHPAADPPGRGGGGHLRLRAVLGRVHPGAGADHQHRGQDAAAGAPNPVRSLFLQLGRGHGGRRGHRRAHRAALSVVPQSTRRRADRWRHQGVMILSLTTQSLYFTGPRAVEVRTEPLAGPGPGQVLLDLQVSGISAGTALNVFRGLAPQWRQAMDPRTRLFSDAHGSDWSWPARYGYAAVGRVAELGKDARGLDKGDLVFAYVPHGSH